MSPKNPPRDTRVAPKEMIVTRRKSAQQKRQLRDKDRSMKSITQLLKSPTRATTLPKKPKMSPKKSPKKKFHQEPAKEDTPRATERRQKTERVWLKPKHNFKMVARTNKRKLCTPQRDSGPPITRSPVSPGSAEPPDMMQLIEENDSLDDEDLMEILTCPSPVWWEDPPNPCYSEKAIYTRSPNLLPRDSERMTENNKTEIVTNKKSITENYKKDLKFLKKRNKLEGILGSIKNKKNIPNEEDDKSDVDCELINDEMLKTLENMDIPIGPKFNKCDIKTEKVLPTIRKRANEIKIEKDELNNTNANLENKRKIETVKVPENLPPLQRNPMHPVSILEKQKSDRKRAMRTSKLEKNDVFPGNSSHASTKNTKNNMNCEANELQLTEKDQESKNKLESNEIAHLDNNEMKGNPASSSPELDKIESKDLDTISDTNIRFIDKVEDKELDDTSLVILDKIKKFFQEKEKKFKQKEYITVYKIVDNDDKSEMKNEEQSKINYFYKKCKNVRKNNESREVYANKTLALPNSEVKYCFRCSSIFETKECHYCARSEDPPECVCDKTQEIPSDLSCDKCDSTDTSEHVNCKSK